eukprot:364430-Chlamydomonas_euryale.AAC.12
MRRDCSIRQAACSCPALLNELPLQACTQLLPGNCRRNGEHNCKLGHDNCLAQHGHKRDRRMHRNKPLPREFARVLTGHAARHVGGRRDRSHCGQLHMQRLRPQHAHRGRRRERRARRKNRCGAD